MNWETDEHKLALRCASVLCAASALAWTYFATTWTRDKTAGDIKLPLLDDDADAPVLPDEDIPQDLETWKSHILWRKMACTAVSAATLVAWAVELCVEGNTLILLHTVFWLSFTVICATWISQNSVYNHRRITVVLALLGLLATCERLGVSAFLPSQASAGYCIALYTTAAPALIFYLTLAIRRSPPLITRSAFTYADSQSYEATSHEESATLLSIITFEWVTPMIHNVLQQTRSKTPDLSVPYLHSRNRSYKLYHTWKRSCAASLSGGTPTSSKEEALGRCPTAVNGILWRIVQANRSTFFVVWFFDILLACARNLPAFTVKHFLRELEAADERGTTKFAWAWLVIMVVSIALRTLVMAADYFRWNGRLQIRSRIQVATLVFERALLSRQIPSPRASEDGAVERRSDVFNLFTTDSDRISLAIDRLSEIFILFPIGAGLGIFMLVKNLGTAAIPGLLVLAIFTPISQYFVHLTAKTQAELMRATDVRMATSSEVLSSMKHVKLMAHEMPYRENILHARKVELAALRKNQLTKALLETFSLVGPGFTLFVSLFWYSKVQGRELTAAIAFSSVIITDVLRRASEEVYHSIGQWTLCLNAARRLETFFNLEISIQGQTLDRPTFPLAPAPDWQSPSQANPIQLESAVVQWTTGDLIGQTQVGSPGISVGPLSVTFGPGLHLICGPIASGKTLMLLGLLGEVPLVAGQISRPYSRYNTLPLRSEDLDISEENWLTTACAFVPQTPWLLSGTVRDNILFGLPMNENRLVQVIHACCLLPDLLQWTHSLDTEIGERGVILSGGQKARVALARAMYSRAAYIYLDDVLSAVDAQTSQHIVNHCLVGPIAANRTLILVSHHAAKCAPLATTIVHLDQGRPAFVGTSASYLATELYHSDISFSSNRARATHDIEDNEDLSGGSAQTPAPVLTQLSDDNTTKASPGPVLKQPSQQIVAEKRGEGSVGFRLWLFWARGNGGIVFWTVAVMASVAFKAVWIIRDAVVGQWTEALKAVETPSPQIGTYYLNLLLILSVTIPPFVGLRGPILYYGSRRFCRTIYERLLSIVMRAPMRFFDTTSIGTLLNRFGADTTVIDIELPEVLANFGNCAIGLLVILVSMLAVTPWFLLPMSVLAAMYRHFGVVYMAASRELRRAEVINRSPVLALYSEMLSGRQVIRAFGGTSRILLQQLQKIDRWQVFDNYMWALNRWLSVRFELLSLLLLACVGCAGLLLRKNGMSVGYTGFLLAATSRAYQEAMLVMRYWTRVEIALVSVERVKEFCEVDSEAPAFTEVELPQGWPAPGRIVVNNLSARYAPTLPDVLKNISFEIDAGTRVAVVGATGSGKSTLSLTLTRIIEASAGKISFDGVDISQVGLYDLRSRMTIVPQDPTILSGSLRQALDPLNEGFSDQTMFAALRAVHLIAETASGLESLATPHCTVFQNLDSAISERGENFSAGERQLICLARAILKRHKIVILDEATSSVDYETDRIITDAITKQFKGVTLLTIAHRLRTIISYDKVLVMSEGTIVELGSPVELLRNKNSRFHALCRAAGPQEFETLRSLANSE